MRARYDAAQTTDSNYLHWSEADALSAKAANSYAVRHKLRTRARYEAANNSYCRGIVNTLANDLIGTGPKLQMMADKGLNRRIEAAWWEWADEVDLALKLRIMREARAVDGEAFALLTNNPRLESPVQLDVRLYEADQFMTPFPYPLDPLAVDGIKFDQYMNPIEYHLLWSHPGDDYRWAYGFEFDRIPADYVIHWFQHTRPQQYRGVPDLTPALPLFAQLRRYTLAVIAAAETAADFAAVLQTTLPPDDDGLVGEPFESLQIEKRMMTTLPAGYQMAQFRAEQPVNTYQMFKSEILDEILRCLNMPHNIGAGNSSGYNYSSGRLDHQTYYRTIGVDQDYLSCEVLDPIFEAWLAEMALVNPAMVPGGADRPEGWPHRWLWKGLEHVDPHKEAQAQEVQLKNYMTTFSDECQQQGIDPESRAQQIAEDLAMFERLGIPLPAAWAAPIAPAASNSPPPQDNGGPGNADQSQNGYADGALVRRNGHARPRR